MFDPVKFKYIIKPFLLIGISCLIGYSLLHILLLRNNAVLPFREDLFRLFYTLIVPIIPVFIWLRRGLNQLQFRAGKKNVFGYGVAAVVAISVPITILQSYIPQVAASNAHLQNIRAIPNNIKSRYYHIDSLYPSERASSQRWMSQITGRFGHRLEFHHYMVLPVYSDRRASDADLHMPTVDTSATLIIGRYYSEEQRSVWLKQHVPIAWIGLHHEDYISNRALPIDKSSSWQKFQSATEQHLASAYWDTINEWEQMKNDVHRQRITELIPSSQANKHLLILAPRKSPVHTRHVYYIAWTITSYIAGVILFWLLVAVTKIREQ